jgi:hypothetical protein
MARRCRRSGPRSTSSKDSLSPSARLAARPPFATLADAVRTTCSSAASSVIDHRFLQFSFPTWWHYDVLRGLDELRDAGFEPDDRLAEGVTVVEAKRDGDGRWRLDRVWPGDMPFELEAAGEPSRWITLRALRVVRWFDDAPQRSRTNAA